MSENPYYRAVLVELKDYFADKPVLTATEVAGYLKCDPRTATKKYGITRDGIHIAKLALMLSKQ